VTRVPPFTAAHEALRTEVRAYVEAELRPHAPAWEAARWFPAEVFHGLAERGWLGLKYGEGADCKTRAFRSSPTSATPTPRTSRAPPATPASGRSGAARTRS
jgi:alkylation response protein AidB-like acyl-CoA dehydrogenase